ISLKFSLDSIRQSSLPTNLISSVPYDYALMRGTGPAIAKAGYDFDSLFIPFRCVASDIEQKRSVVFRSGDLAQAVRASSAYPFYFRPATVNGKILYDGGLYDNFPSDVMEQEFHPDFIIGINASGNDRPASETDLVSLLQAMMTNPTNLSMNGRNGILIDLDTDDFGLFDFSDVDKIIREGYRHTTDSIPRILASVSRRSDASELRLRRSTFRKSMKPVVVDDILIEGVNSKQRSYIRSVMKKDTGAVPLESLRMPYFRLISDKNIRQIDPQLIFDSTDGTFDLRLRVKRERDLITRFGGNISSRPISEVFGGLTYLVWGRRAYSFSTNFYFGKLYTSGQAKIRMEAPTRLPYYLELDATLNQYDFYRSVNAFFPEQRPTYILKSDYHFGLSAGVPTGNKAKIYGSAGYVRLADNYYQTPNFTQADTADKTTFKGVTAQISYEWNTLNKKQFASEGARLQWRVRFTALEEKTIPGSTSIDRSIISDQHTWFQSTLKYDKFFFERSRFKAGFNLSVLASNMPLFNNFTVTSVNAPAFEPILEMQTLYLPDYRALNFAGGGIRNIFSVRSNIDFRLEGYLFQPYQQLLKTPDNKATLGLPFNKRFFSASGGLVFHSPIGPLSLHVNYYSRQKNPVSVLFTAGFLLFHPGALE
ncbi:MAG: hypothetical protein RL021_377, partial [Bacteroidota bacterium]